MNGHILYRIFCCLFILSATATVAQQRELTLEDAILRERSTLAPQTVQQLAWQKTVPRFAYVQNQGPEQQLVSEGPHDRQPKTVVALADLNSLLKEAREPEAKGFPATTWMSDNQFRFFHNKKLYVYTFDLSPNAETQKLEVKYGLSPDAAHVDVEPATLTAAYTKGQNLYIMLPDGTEHALTTDDTDGIVNGQAAHRQEFGIHKGTFWSPNGQALAWYRMDETMVTKYPIVSITDTPASVEHIRYPMAGDKSHHVQVRVYHLQTGQSVTLELEQDPETYYTNIAWTPDNRFIVMAVINREQDRMWLNKYDAATGQKVMTLFEERHPKYVEPLTPVLFVRDNPNWFVWQSQRDGINHLYLYDVNNGRLIRKLSTGSGPVTEVVGFDAGARNIYFIMSTDYAMGRHLFSADMRSGKQEQLTSETGMHTASIDPTGSYFINRYHSTTVPNVQRIIGLNGKEVKLLMRTENPLKDIKTAQVRLGTLTTADGTVLNYRMVLPADFSERTQYPSITYVYGGPHAQMVHGGWNNGAPLWMHWLANQGYIVFTVDGRGSANRGRDFEQALFRNLGTVEVEDQVLGNQFLRRQPFVDTARMGIHGWSYGGFMATSLMLHRPGLYHVGVAGGPVINWRYYEVMYTERYMDRPQTNPQGYYHSNLLNHVGKLRGKLLLVHGTSDDVVVWQQSLALVKKAVDEGVVGIDYFMYPGHPHNVIGKDRVHLIRKVSMYLMENLERPAVR